MAGTISVELIEGKIIVIINGTVSLNVADHVAAEFKRKDPSISDESLQKIKQHIKDTIQG